MKVAIFGTGSIGTRHLKAFSRKDGEQPIAVPLRSLRLKQLQAEGFAAATDIKAAAIAGATAAVIATDTVRHVKDAMAAMKLGMDVLVEKPLSTDAGKAHKLVLSSKKSGRALHTACVMRFFDSLRCARERLKDIGRLKTVEIECRSYLPDWRPDRDFRKSYSARKGEGGVLLDMIHEIDYAGWIFGWPKAVKARLRNLGKLGIETEEIAELSWETDDGCRVSLILDYLTAPTRRGMRAAGENGLVVWDAAAGTVESTIAEKTDHWRTQHTRDDALAEQARMFLALKSGSSDPRLATGIDGVRALAVCDAARRASESGTETPVLYPL